MCKKEQVIKVKPKDYYAWQNGKLIQVAMPYLTAGEREMLISGVCEDCFSSLFSDDDEEPNDGEKA
jgi:hypothetical protein